MSRADRVLHRRSRREFLRFGVMGLGLIGLGAACTPAPAPASKPAEPAKPAEAAKPTAAPATPVTAVKPAEAPKPAEVTKPAEAAKPAAPAVAKPSAATGKIVVQLGVEPTNLDLHLNTSGRLHIGDSVIEGLILRDPDMKLQPNLATSWERIDPLRMRFKLRQGVKFHNGETFNASAIVLAVKRITDPESKSQQLTNLDTLASAVAVDDYTVDIITSGPDPILLQRMIFLPVMAPEALTKDASHAAEKPIGTGPYQIVEWVKGQRIALTAFDGYWGDLKATIKDVDIQARKESAVRMSALKAGEAHLIDNITPEDTKLLAPEQVVTVRASETLSIRMNCKTGVTMDKRVRQAMSYAVDRASIVKDIYQGFGEPSNGQIYNSDTFGFDPGLKDYPYDLAKAKQLVKDAGAEGKEIVLTGASANRWLKDREIQEAVAAMITQSGLKVNLRLLELTEVQKAFFEIDNPVVQGSFTSPSSDLQDADRVLTNYTKTGGRVSLYSNPELDKLFDAERAELDTEKRRALLQQMGKLVYDELPIMAISAPNWIYGVSSKLKFKAYPTGQLPFNRMSLTT